MRSAGLQERERGKRKEKAKKMRKKDRKKKKVWCFNLYFYNFM